MCDVLKLHDEMLDFEKNIHGKVEELAHYVVNDVLSEVIDEVERYKEFIEEKEEQIVRNG